MPKALCKHCKREFEVTTWDNGRARFPQHRLPDSHIACDGTGELVAIAGQDYAGPLFVPPIGKIEGLRGTNVGERMERAKRQPKPKLEPPRPTAAPSFYDKEELDTWDDTIPF